MSQPVVVTVPVLIGGKPRHEAAASPVPPAPAPPGPVSAWDYALIVVAMAVFMAAKFLDFRERLLRAQESRDGESRG